MGSTLCHGGMRHLTLLLYVAIYLLHITCASDCGRGFYQAHEGCKECQDNCTSCTQINMCDECRLGKWGEACTFDCDTNCRDKACNLTSGKCNNGCKSLFYQHGKTCYDCPSDCTSCTSNSDCQSCVDGKSGSYCRDSCHPSCFKCNQTNSKHCNSCKTGYFLTKNTCTPCPENCSQCSSVNVCTKCTTGYTLAKNRSSLCAHSDKCTVCATGFYMNETSEFVPCSKNCKGDNSCRISDGLCENGCIEGWTGQTCDEAEVANTSITYQDDAHDMHDDDDDSSTTIIAAAAGGAVFILIVAGVTVACVVAKIRRKRRHSKEADAEIASPAAPAMSFTAHHGNNAEEYVYATPNKVKKSTEATLAVTMQEAPLLEPYSTFDMDEEDEEIDENTDISIPMIDDASPIDDNIYYTNVVGLQRCRVSVAKLKRYVDEKTKDEFKKEFQKLPQGLTRPCNDALKPENRSKNRYKTVYPYDVSRVKLLSGDSDYINANYIDGYNHPKAFIASLGPTKATMKKFEDFWRMVWQENVEKIVMLTNLFENMQIKCEQYWPDAGTSACYGDVNVTCHTEDTYAEHTVKRMTISKGEISRLVHHIHFTTWPDKGVPDEVTSLIEFSQKVQSIKSELNGPVIVHCSAGVGRTGTYIALDKLIKEGMEEESVDISGCVIGMRSQRLAMVQTEEQYEFLHQCVVHALTYESQAIQESQFRQYVSNSTELLHEQYKVENCFHSCKEIYGRNGWNKGLNGKNRKGADIPSNRHRPKLHLYMKQGESDYINATYVNDYKTRNRYIVAQTPLPETLVDFLRLMVQENCSCVVSMDETISYDKNVGVYVPAANQVLKHDVFQISCTSCKPATLYTLSQLKIRYGEGNRTKEKTINHFQLNSWTKNTKLAASPSDFLLFINDVEKSSNEFEDSGGPILIHCLNGGERSGLFCAVSVLIQKMEVDHEVSVVNTNRQIKSRRPAAIPNKEQYVFCHECVDAYLQTDSD